MEGDAPMTDHQFNRFITALNGIEKQIKELRKEISERDARRDARQVPPEVNPWGYTE